MSLKIKTIQVKTLEEEVLLDLFGDNLTIYSIPDYEEEDEEYRVDECALILESDEGELLIVDDTGQGTDYLIEVFQEANLIIK